MSDRLPTVSVLLLCWNHERFLEQCIRSLAQQTDRDFEIIFLDNLSTDGSFDLAASLFEKYSLPATMLRNEQPRGISQNLNALLAASGGELVCPLSTDDWYRPRFIQAMRAAASADTDAAWFYGEHVSFVEGVGETVDCNEYVDGNIWPELLRAQFKLNMNGAAYRRSALNAIGGWDESMRLEDIDLVFRLAEKGTCHRVDEPLAVYRFHPAGASEDPDFMVEGVREFFAKHRRHFSKGGRPATAETIRQFAARAVDDGRPWTAIQLLVTALRTDPLNRLIPRTALYVIRRLLSPSARST